MYLHAQVATSLFMVLSWSLGWEKRVSFPNQQATHLGFVQDSVRINLHTILDSIVKSYKCKGVGQIIYFIFEATALENQGLEVCHP